MIDKWTVERVKDAADIVDVIEDYIPELKKKGAEWECLCPFHDDHHVGSFRVSRRKNIYHCFSCNAHGGPVDFLMDYAGMNFYEAIQYLGQKYGIPVEGSEKFTPKPCKPHVPAPPLPLLTIPLSMRMHTTRDIVKSEDRLVRWLLSLPWNSEQLRRIEKTLDAYHVGTTRDGSGFTIFWLVDEYGRTLTGKMLRYGEDGHRLKTVKYNSDWIHSRLARAGKYDDKKWDTGACLWGEHLLNIYPKATVNLVESEKTALIMAIAYGNPHRQLWLATGGKGNLNAERLAPIVRRGMHVVLYPDHDAIEEWEKRVDAIGYDRLTINTKYVTDLWVESDGPKADVADIVTRLICQKLRRQGPLTVGTLVEKWREEHPAFAALEDKFNIKPTEGNAG